jgi:hypothetical protein
MYSDKLPPAPGASSRSLKIEEAGDFAANNIKSKIRLMGR